MDDTIRIILSKILTAIQKDRTLLTYYPKTNLRSSQITVRNLEDLAGNHLFDDHPELFRITKMEGKRVRAFFQSHCTKRAQLNSVLRKEFPYIIEDDVTRKTNVERLDFNGSLY